MPNKKKGLTTQREKILCDFCLCSRTVVDEVMPGFLGFEYVKCSKSLKTFNVGDCGGIGKQRCIGFEHIESNYINAKSDLLIEKLEGYMAKKMLNKKLKIEDILVDLYADVKCIDDLDKAREELLNKVLEDLTKPDGGNIAI